jgi:hypothetical protein
MQLMETTLTLVHHVMGIEDPERAGRQSMTQSGQGPRKGYVLNKNQIRRSIER